MQSEWVFEEPDWYELVLRRQRRPLDPERETELNAFETWQRLDEWQRAQPSVARPRLRQLSLDLLGRSTLPGNGGDAVPADIIKRALFQGGLLGLERLQPRPIPQQREAPAPPPPSEPPPPPKKTWVEFQLLDEEGVPVPEEKYSIELPDGSSRNGDLDGDGKARIDDIDEGTCWVTFPEIKVRPRA